APERGRCRRCALGGIGPRARRCDLLQLAYGPPGAAEREWPRAPAVRHVPLPRGAPQGSALMHVVVHQTDGVSTLPALPLAAGLLVASARRDSTIAAAARLTIHSARLDPEAVAASHPQPDVLAFSTYAWNERHSLEVARCGKARHPAAFVVFGGPSVP